jgi:RNA polymerase sigma factor (sigma-70 family)
VTGTAPRPDASFEDAFDQLAGIAYRVAYRLLGSRPEAEDVAQEALARAFARWRRVRGHAEPWVATVAANLALDHLRSAAHRRRSPVGLDLAVAGGAGEVRPGGAADGAAVDRVELARLLASLPRRQREVIVLRYLADRSEADTADALGTSVGTVKRHAHRGLATLRETWASIEAEPTPEPGGA